jgi:hypothetical protein
MGVPPPAISHLHLKDEISRQTVWRVIQDSKRHVAQRHVSEPAGQLEVSQAAQIDHYQPTLESSFNRGLGAGVPWQYIRKTIQTITGRELDPYERKAEEIQLRKFISQKDENPVLGRVRQILKDHVEQIFGFDGSSDKDSQFGDLNDLARFLVRFTNRFEDKIRLNPRKLVQATLIVAYRNTPHRAKVEEFILKTEPTLYCPRCKARRSYVQDKDPKYFLCICGKRIPTSRAKPGRPRKMDGRYVATIERMLATMPVQNSGIIQVNNL